MGLLDSVIGGVLGQVLGGGQGGARGGSAMSPLVKALLMLLLAKGASGGFGDIFGRGHAGEPGPDADRSEPGRPHPEAGPYGRDVPGSGGWDQDGARRDAPLPPGDFSDLSGMLDGPGDAPGRDPGTGPYAHLDREPEDRPDLGGLDGLIEGFRKSGLGDVIESWVGHGQNRSVQPNQLAQALGPDTLGTLERATGMNRDTLLAQLAQVLPQVVDGLTPPGRVPGEGERRGW
jgi:uncharacterized protein YidB (DUF937 family)